jgi:hypothetical protein
VEHSGKMATALITTFFDAKMKNAETRIALYSVSSDVDGARIVKQMDTPELLARLRFSWVPVKGGQGA